MRYLNLFIVALLADCAHAQQINQGPRTTSLGNSGVAIQDVWSLQSNPAGMAIIENAQIAIACQSSISDPSITTRSAVLAIPSRYGVVGIGLQDYGITQYKEGCLGVAYSRRFGSSVFVAMKFNVHQISISKYGTAEAWSVETGIQYAPTDNLILGAHVSNPNHSEYTSNNETNAVVPAIIELGAYMTFSEKVSLNSAIVKELNSPPGVRLGIEYNIAGKVFLRGGTATRPFKQFAGFGCRYQAFTIDAALTFHPNLGYSPQLALSYVF